jgi:hypothetical protein
MLTGTGAVNTITGFTQKGARPSLPGMHGWPGSADRATTPGASSPHPGVVAGIERWGQLAPRADSQPG